MVIEGANLVMEGPRFGTRGGGVGSVDYFLDWCHEGSVACGKDRTEGMEIEL